MKLKALIVEDEPFARDDLRHMLGCRQEIEIAGEAATIAAAKRQLSENAFDVVFLDIQLRGGSGFELIPFVDLSTDIIFTTAHDEYAVRAFEINALDYILKPITAARLHTSIERLKTNKAGLKAPSKSAGPFEPEDRIFVKTDSGQLFIHLKEILAISSIGGNYTAIKLRNSEDLLSRKTLKEWESTLPESVFSRIHRATIINLGNIQKISKNKDRSYIVTLSGLEESFTVSRRMAYEFKKLIEDLKNR